MRVKLIGLSLVIAAWCACAAIPSAVSASPLLTFPTGTSLATGSLLKVTNIGVARFVESQWTVECPTANVTGKLAKNSGSSIEIEFSTMELHGLGAGGDCRQDRTTGGTTEVGSSVNVSYSGLPWCFKANPLIGEDGFEIRGGSCGGEPKNVTMVLNYTGLGECKYQASAIRGSFVTHPEDAMLTMKTLFEKEVTSPFFCASTINSETAMTMERDALTSEPVYIS
jgi:hypothetical protein